MTSRTIGRDDRLLCSSGSRTIFQIPFALFLFWIYYVASLLIVNDTHVEGKNPHFFLFI